MNKHVLKVRSKTAPRRSVKPRLSEQQAMRNKEVAFVNAYFQCGFNATEAAKQAGYKGNRNTLGVVGHDNLRKPKIAKMVAERMADSAMAADEVLARLADQARGTLDDFFNAKGLIDLRHARQRGKMHLLKSYSRGQRGTRIEIYDAQAALVQIGRHLGLFSDRDLSLNLDMSQLTGEQLDRIAAGEDPVRVLANTSPG